MMQNNHALYLKFEEKLCSLRNLIPPNKTKITIHHNHFSTIEEPIFKHQLITVSTSPVATGAIAIPHRALDMIEPQLERQSDDLAS